MKIKPTTVTSLVLAGCCAFAWSAKAASFFDNFNSYAGSSTYNSGPDVSAGWLHYPSLNIGLGNTWTFPVLSAGNQGYKLTSLVGTDTNPGRVGSWYNAAGFQSITDFVVAADLVNWGTGNQQEMGLMARSDTQLFNVPSCYVLVLHHDNVGPGPNSRIEINKIDPVNLVTRISNGDNGRFNVNGASPAPDPALGAYRLVFWGVGPNLYGQILDSTGTPMMFNDGFGGLTDIVSATDSSYTSGRTGVLGYIDDIQGVDPTFDNFFVTTVVPEPGTAALACLGLGCLLAIRRRR